MRTFTIVSKALLYISVSLTFTNAAFIPLEWARAAEVLIKRTVTYGDTGKDSAKSSVCNADQRKVIEQSMGEVVKFAKAGSDGLSVILDMLTDEKSEYRALPEAERNRYRETYFTFFGEITKKNQLDLFRSRATFIKTVLDRVSPLTIESWPEQITIFCDSTYYQDTDNEGNTWDQVSPPKEAPAKISRAWKYDHHQKIWSDVLKATDCNLPGATVAGYTLRLNADNDGGKEKPSDRITFCPAWFEVIKSPEAGKSFTDLDPKADIKKGMKMSEFAKKSGRIFFHEHLHTYAFNQMMDKSKMLDDVVGVPNSYGATNAQVLAKKPETQDKANRNIENVVYWCIAMFYDEWNWAKLSGNNVE